MYKENYQSNLHQSHSHIISLCLNNSKTNKLRCPNTINKLNKNCVFKTCRDCFEFEELNINNNKKLKCNSTVEIDMEEDI